MAYVYAFIAGFAATLVFHQGVLALLHALALSPRAPWSVQPVPPFGVPAVVSLAFWGGVWGMALWPLLRRASQRAYWLRALVVGAIAPSLVALLVVFPLKDLPVTPPVMVGALIVNAAWGLGLAVFMRLLTRLPH